MARLFIYQSSFTSQFLDLIYWMVTIFIFDGMHCKPAIIYRVVNSKIVVEITDFIAQPILHVLITTNVSSNSNTSIICWRELWRNETVFLPLCQSNGLSHLLWLNIYEYFRNVIVIYVIHIYEFIYSRQENCGKTWTWRPSRSLSIQGLIHNTQRPQNTHLSPLTCAIFTHPYLKTCYWMH